MEEILKHIQNEQEERDKVVKTILGQISLHYYPEKFSEVVEKLTSVINTYDENFLKLMETFSLSIELPTKNNNN